MEVRLRNTTPPPAAVRGCESDTLTDDQEGQICSLQGFGRRTGNGTWNFIFVRQRFRLRASTDACSRVIDHKEEVLELARESL